MKKRSLIPILYIAFLMLPIYWLVAMSFKTTNEILSGFSLFLMTPRCRIVFALRNWFTYRRVTSRTGTTYLLCIDPLFGLLGFFFCYFISPSLS